MDNKKIGTLIKQLRKKKGITQQELGDMLGIGFRSVSKWERGLTCPDITIINELSKILGISSDELLSGKINKEHKDKKIPSKFKITFSIAITITVILITSFIYYYNTRTYAYTITCDNPKYYIEGKAIFNKKNIMIITNKLVIKNKELSQIRIKNYEYQVILNKENIISYGRIPYINNIEQEYTIAKFADDFQINYNGKITTIRKEILNNPIIIKLEFTTEENQIINEEIYLKLIPTKDNFTNSTH